MIRESTADSSFSISKDPRGNTLGRGTEITLFLKEDAMEFLNQARLEEIIKKHSEFITFPIYLYKKTEEVVEKTAEKEEDAQTTEDGMEVAEEDESQEEAPKTEKVSPMAAITARECLNLYSIPVGGEVGLSPSEWKHRDLGQRQIVR